MSQPYCRDSFYSWLAVLYNEIILSFEILICFSVFVTADIEGTNYKFHLKVDRQANPENSIEFAVYDETRLTCCEASVPKTTTGDPAKWLMGSVTETNE